MSVAKDIKTLLTTETANNVYKNSAPDTPNNISCIFDTGGYSSEHQLGSGVAPIYDRPTIQVMVRDTSYENAYTRAVNIKKALDGKTNTTINGNRYISIFIVGDINSIGHDSRGRSRLTLNFEINVERG